MSIRSLHIGLASMTLAVFAAEGLGLGLSADSRRTAYIVHKDGQPSTLELSPSGRVLTENFERPEWSGNAVLALLSARTTFYTDRLGPELAEPLLTTNIINYDDLGWVALDDEGLEVEVLADDEYRQNMLSATLGIDRETGDIEGSITEHYIDRDNAGYTLADIAEKADTDAHFGADESKQAATGNGNG